MAAYRPAAWRHRLLLLPPSQGGDHRRRWHAEHRQSRIRPAVPPAAPARHDRSRYGAARLQPGDFRELWRGRLQLPDDRCAGRDWPRATRTLARDRGNPAQAGGTLHRAAIAEQRGHSPTGRTRLGPQQLAELLRHPAAAGRPACSDADAARSRHLDKAWCDERPSRTRLSRARHPSCRG
ncbi:hypothetical protein D9M68_836110 [compost metagenome]